LKFETYFEINFLYYSILKRSQNPLDPLSVRIARYIETQTIIKWIDDAKK